MSTSSSKTIIAVSGPTAIGKTSLAIKLARHFYTEIISADSRQFYKEMSIGTAVPNATELAAVPHHFIQHKSIHDYYTVGSYEKDAIQKTQSIFSTKEQLVLVGGSGLYMNAVLNGMDEFPNVDPAIRNELNHKYKTQGIIVLQELLKKHDPVYFQKVDISNPQRIIRALEVSIQAKTPYSSFLDQPKKDRDFKHIHLGLTAPREIIYDRINKRVAIMLEAGLLDEAEKLFEYRSLNALQTVGYKELFRYFEGAHSLDFAIAEIKKNTRRYAKRQLTWLRRNPTVNWIEYDTDFEEVINIIERKL
ncbi:tRNA (adenosine(37)-N6)-dimethylallyltransferase MiaA [Flavobacteriaceae bacterium M23B6Z8]